MTCGAAKENRLTFEKLGAWALLRLRAHKEIKDQIRGGEDD